MDTTQTEHVPAQLPEHKISHFWQLVAIIIGVAFVIYSICYLIDPTGTQTLINVILPTLASLLRKGVFYALVVALGEWGISRVFFGVEHLNDARKLINSGIRGLTYVTASGFLAFILVYFMIQIL